MPALRLVMASSSAGPSLRQHDNSPPPVLVFDEDSADETWGAERSSGRKRRAIPDSSDEEADPTVRRGPGRPRGPSSKLRQRGSKRLSSADISRTVSGEGDIGTSGADDQDDDDDEGNDSQTALPHIPNGPWGKRDFKNIEGETYQIEADELKLDDDPLGETKIDRHGRLLGGREFSTSTFSSPYRHDTDRQYILAIDACRAVGFRDTSYFFKRNPLLYKLICQQIEKDDLIAEGKLHPNLRARPVTMITARNFYKLFGARVVIGGHYVRDDYYEEHARYEEHKPEETAIVEIYDPEIDSGTLAIAKLPEQRRTRTGFAGDVARSRPTVKSSVSKSALASLSGVTGPRDARYGGAGLPPFRNYDPNSKAKRPDSDLSQSNWVYMYARAVHQANRDIHNWREGHSTSVAINSTVAEQIAAAEADDAEREAEEEATKMEEDAPPRAKRRRARSPTRGIFDSHTFVPLVRRDIQPERARLEHVSLDPQFEGASGRALAKAGFSTVVIESDVLSARDEEALLTGVPWSVPGTWDFRTGVSV